MLERREEQGGKNEKEIMKMYLTNSVMVIFHTRKIVEFSLQLGKQHPAPMQNSSVLKLQQNKNYL
jgi:hypothetical protein